ncbi:cytochrome c3 family protein, partial [bacterium]|nr:cytochrome c3 family protein [bacterium]
TWDDVTFDHLEQSGGFDLIGSHNVLACESCHNLPGLELLFAPPPTNNDDCASCHTSDYESAHAGSGFPETCATCHGQTTWVGATFDHVVQANGFDLIGSHNVLACESCHNLPGLDLLFAPAPSNNDDCASCHSADYETAHAGSGFPVTCVDCHGQTTWEDATFDHLQQSGGFDLIGSHNVLACESCHNLPGLELLFAPPPSNNDDCASCHTSDYETAHAGSGFPVTCVDCHSQTTWAGATFDHVAQSGGFDLIGSHNVLACASCHNLPGLDLLFAPPPANNNDCASCHTADYETAHAGSGFPVTCAECHGQTTWAGATFDHVVRSDGFDLIGSHSLLACESCHNLPGLDLLFAPPPANNNDCVTCHSSDYQTAHAGSGFPVACVDCHSQSTWSGATFDHVVQSRGFDLIGSHNTLACASCHNLPGLDLLFAPPPANNNDCVTCHTSDYQTAHAGSGFPTTCIDCHSQTTWAGATFDHDAQFFPIYSGKHRNEWTQCADCHRQAPASFATFSCIDCHEHQKSEMDSEHRGINGYVYESVFCLSCHPQGRE